MKEFLDAKIELILLDENGNDIWTDVVTDSNGDIIEGEEDEF